MQKSFYQANTPEEALIIYLQGEKELYARVKRRTIKEIFYGIYGDNFRNNLRVLEVGAGGGIWTNFFL